jgi:hypothetical protein
MICSRNFSGILSDEEISATAQLLAAEGLAEAQADEGSERVFAFAGKLRPSASSDATEVVLTN